MRKSFKIISIVIAILLAVLLIALLLVSPVAKNYLNNHGETLLGRKVQLERLRLNVLTGTLQAGGLVVYEEDGATPFVRLDTLDVHVRLSKLLQRELELRHATLSTLEVTLLQDGSRFNFSSIIDHFAPADSSAARDTSAAPWTFGLYNISLRHWQVHYADLQRGSTWELKDVNLQVPGLYLGGEQNTDAGLELELADGGKLLTKLNYNVQSNDFELDMTLQQLGVANARAYLSDAMNVGTMQGTLSGTLQAAGNLSEITHTKIYGALQLADVALHDRDRNPVLSLQQLTVAIHEIDLNRMRFALKSVELTGPATRFDRYADGNNFSHFFATGTAQPQQASGDRTTGTPSPTLVVDRLVIADGRADYSDHTLEEPMNLSANAIALSADHVTLQGATRATLAAALSHGATVQVQWHGNPNDIKANSALNATVRGVQLADFSPYSVHYLAYPFTDGILSFSSENTIVNSQIEGRNRLDIANPMVGDRRGDIDSARHIPLKAALYILKDKNDNVLLDVPVSGNLDNPKFNYWKALWKTLGNLLVKVTASPLNKIGDALGMHNGETPFIAVDPMQSDLTADQLTKLNKLAGVVKADSSMVLIIAQQIPADAEDAILLLGEQRNEQVRCYMRSLGVRNEQLMVLTQEGLTNVRRIGYKIDSELRDPEAAEEFPME